MRMFALFLLCIVLSVRSQSSDLPESYLQQSSYQKQLQGLGSQSSLDYDQQGSDDYDLVGDEQSSSACCGPPQPCCPAPLPQESCCLVTPPCCPPKPCCQDIGFWPFPVSPRWPIRSFYLLRRPLPQGSVYYPPPAPRPCCPYKRLPCCVSPPCCPIKPCCQLEIPYCRRACPECPCRQALNRRAKRFADCVQCTADGSLQRAKRNFGQCIPCRYGQPLVSHREKRNFGADQCDATCRGSPVDPYHHNRFKRLFAPDCDPCEQPFDRYTQTRNKRSGDVSLFSKSRDEVSHREKRDFGAQCVQCVASRISAATMLQRTKRNFGDQCVACVNPTLHARRIKRTLASGCRPCESPYFDGEPYRSRASRAKRQSRVCPCIGSAAFLHRIKRALQNGCDNTCRA